jgi:transcriptional regulator with XRE-family HTH domain
MSASAVVRAPARVPLEQSPFHSAEYPNGETPRCSDESKARQIKQLLKRAGLTMAQVSVLTRRHYGTTTPYFIPASFLYKLKKGTTPHICQIAALSKITGYRFSDWMSLCGFDPKLILPLQLKLHVERTAILTPDRDFPTCGPFEFSAHQESDARYFFAKIGRRDAVVYPSLVPGSIVRADRWYPPEALEDGFAHERVWLVQHPGGLTCCFVRRMDSNHVYLLPKRPPLTSWPLRISKEVRLLGLVDLEIRPRTTAPFEPMSSPMRTELLPVAPGSNTNREFSTLLRASRSRAGLTFRAAHKMTQQIARLLGKAEYAISLGLLSDYEAMNKVPRHIAKIMSLCIIYGIDPFVLIEAGGIHMDDSDKASLSPEYQMKALRKSA